MNYTKQLNTFKDKEKNLLNTKEENKKLLNQLNNINPADTNKKQKENIIRKKIQNLNIGNYDNNLKDIQNKINEIQNIIISIKENLTIINAMINKYKMVDKHFNGRLNCNHLYKIFSVNNNHTLNNNWTNTFIKNVKQALDNDYNNKTILQVRRSKVKPASITPDKIKEGLQKDDLVVHSENLDINSTRSWQINFKTIGIRHKHLDENEVYIDGNKCKITRIHDDSLAISAVISYFRRYSCKYCHELFHRYKECKKRIKDEKLWKQKNHNIINFPYLCGKCGTPALKNHKCEFIKCCHDGMAHVNNVNCHAVRSYYYLFRKMHSLKLKGYQTNHIDASEILFECNKNKLKLKTIYHKK